MLNKFQFSGFSVLIGITLSCIYFMYQARTLPLLKRGDDSGGTTVFFFEGLTETGPRWWWVRFSQCRMLSPFFLLSLTEGIKLMDRCAFLNYIKNTKGRAGALFFPFCLLGIRDFRPMWDSRDPSKLLSSLHFPAIE